MSRTETKRPEQGIRLPVRASVGPAHGAVGGALKCRQNTVHLFKKLAAKKFSPHSGRFEEKAGIKTKKKSCFNKMSMGGEINLNPELGIHTDTQPREGHWNPCLGCPLHLALSLTLSYGTSLPLTVPKFKGTCPPLSLQSRPRAQASDSYALLSQYLWAVSAREVSGGSWKCRMPPLVFLQISSSWSHPQVSLQLTAS